MVAVSMTCLRLSSTSRMCALASSRTILKGIGLGRQSERRCQRATDRLGPRNGSQIHDAGAMRFLTKRGIARRRIGVLPLGQIGT
jgi:hypothetical protein